MHTVRVTLATFSAPEPAGFSILALCDWYTVQSAPARVWGASYQNDNSAKTHAGSRACVGRNLHPDQASYLRGKRYNGEKRDGFKGNQHTDSGSYQNDKKQTNERLAAEYKVSPATIARDGQYAAAVDKLAEAGIEPPSRHQLDHRQPVGPAQPASRSGELLEGEAV